MTADPATRVPGRVTVTARALERVFAAVAAETLGSPARRVSTRLSDDAGRLRVEVSGPASRPADGESLLDVGARARQRIRDDGGRIAGSTIGDVGVRITGCLAPGEGPR